MCIYRSYRKIKTGVLPFWTTLYVAWHSRRYSIISSLVQWKLSNSSLRDHWTTVQLQCYICACYNNKKLIWANDICSKQQPRKRSTFATRTLIWKMDIFRKSSTWVCAHIKIDEDAVDVFAILFRGRRKRPASICLSSMTSNFAVQFPAGSGTSSNLAYRRLRQRQTAATNTRT